MGIFGPTRKDGGLDRRHSENKGGYTGKIMGLFSAMTASSKTSKMGTDESNKKMDDRLKHFENKGDNLVSRDIPDDEQGVIDFIDEMISIIEMNGWYMDQAEDKKAQGRISDLAMSKLEIGIFKLYTLESSYHIFYEKKFIDLKAKKFRGKYLPWIIVAIIFVLLIIANVLMGNF
tara:strand:+ start:1823 stop:2347 length:525 start_codon:yes stop_codon:yes gene_type:complete